MTSAIRAGVAGGWLLCPIEFHTFVELIKQRLPEKRARTAELIDELSCGVTIIMPQERVFIEALRFLQAAMSGPPFPEAPLDEVWTKVAYLVGHGSLTSTKLAPDQLDTLNRLFAEKLWSMPLTEMLDTLGDGILNAGGWQPATTAKLNAEKGPARDRVNNIRRLYLDEFRGTLDVFAPSIGDTMLYLFERYGGNAATVTDAQRDESASPLIALITAALEKHDLSQQLPTVHVMATLYANVQWDRNRKYKDNDFADFGHASAAVAYCNAFATERSLGALLRQTKLDRLYDCPILVNPGDVVQWAATNEPKVDTR
ncbi:MAG TPA: hypothetical protein VGM50_02530 [Gemmatimonadaceae bacterium]